MMAQKESERQRLAPWRERLHEVIFEADTPVGKAFDVALLVAIVTSVIAVMLESVPDFQENYPRFHAVLGPSEILFTALFTVEYLMRLLCTRRPLKYARSFYGVVDLLAVLPTYISLVLPGSYESLIVIRALRLLRVFRVFKLAHFLTEASVLQQAFLASRAKITVFIATVLVLVTIMGAAMYLIEGAENPGFSSIPQSVYWAIVTMTTVGYGDIAPRTAMGEALAAFMMIVGYSLIIVPTGILSVELAQAGRDAVSTQVCPDCSREGHDRDAIHCKYCGGRL